jgi:hypothetical protein
VKFPSLSFLFRMDRQLARRDREFSHSPFISIDMDPDAFLVKFRSPTPPCQLRTRPCAIGDSRPRKNLRLIQTYGNLGMSLKCASRAPPHDELHG